MKEYHLRRSEKAITDPEEIAGLLRKSKWLTIGLCHSHEPYVVNLNYGFDIQQNCLYMHSATQGKKWDIIKNNSAACGTIVEDLGYKILDCDHAFRSLVIDGTISIVENTDEKKHALEILIDHLEPAPEPVRSRFFQGELDYESIGVLRFDIRTVTGKKSL